jgi:hypothetical protein
VLLEGRESQLHRLVELGVAALDVILRADVDLDIGIRAVVLHAPPDIGEPEGVFRLGGEAPVDQGVAGRNSDHATPGSLPHHGAEAEQLEAVGEDVAIGAGVLVGDGHQRPGRGVGRVGLRFAPAADVVPDAPPGELLQHELADVPASVEPDVDDEGVAFHLG